MYNERLIGERIAALRGTVGLSRQELADRVMVSVQAVGKWERGESLPDVITLKRVTEILGVDINELFGEAADARDDQKENATDKADNKGEKTAEMANDWNMSAANWRNGEFCGLKNLAEKFRASNVVGCDFSTSDLSGISFRHNNIKDCKFSRTDFSNAVLSMCNVPDNDFSGARFVNARIKMCDVHGCDFSSADFTSAELKGTAFSKNNLSGAVFNLTRFINSVLQRVVVDSDISDCVFENCVFKHVEFKDMTFRNTFFKNLTMQKATFINCKADKITYAFLKNSKASKSTLDGISVVEN